MINGVKTLKKNELMASVQNVPSVHWFFIVQCLHSAVHGLLLLGFVFYQFAQPLFLNSDIWVFAYLCLFVSLSVDFVYFYFYDKIKSKIFLCGLFLLFDALWMTWCLSAILPALYSVLVFVYLLEIASAGLIGGYRWAFTQGLWVSLLFSWVLILNPLKLDQPIILSFILNNIAFLATAGLSGFFGSQTEKWNWSLWTANQTVQNLSHLNERIVENIDMGLLILNEQLRVVHHNAAAQNLLKLPDSFSDSVQTLFPALQKHITSGQSQKINHLKTEYNRDSDKKVIEMFISPFKDMHWGIYGERLVDTASESKKYLILFQDCTYTRNLERKVRDQEKLTVIGRMSAGIAHEIRNPLSAISGSIQLLDLKNKSSLENKKLVDNSLKEISRLNRIIGDFLDYASDEKSITHNYKIDTLSVNTVLEELLDHIQVNPRWTHVNHHFTLKAHGLIQISSDRLKQIFLNVIKNACEAMEGRQEGQLEIESFDDHEWVVVRVKDNGIGISKKDFPHIFEPFYSKKSGNLRGTGLGLPIVHKLINAFGGHISFENRVVDSNNLGLQETLLSSKDGLKETGTICTLRFPIAPTPVPGEMAKSKIA